MNKLESDKYKTYANKNQQLVIKTFIIRKSYRCFDPRL